MNFQQLRIIRETVRQNFNLTEVANALYASQSGVSKHIKDLEDELGLELFIRKGKRFLGLTDPGKELLVIVERMLLDAANIRRLAEQFSQRDEGQLIIATTHTQARYALPQVVTTFKKAYPKVHLVLHQASPSELVRLLRAALTHGELAPFHRRIADQTGAVQNDGERWLAPEEVLHMDWLCANVRGSIPQYDELLPMARPMVRLLGLYRETLQPEKRGPLL